MPHSPQDLDLLARVAAGEEEAFTFLYRRWQGPLFRFALRMCGTREAAEDVVQETFLAVIRDPGRYDPARGTVSGFLYGIARNHVLKRLERDRPYRAGENESADAESGDPSPLEAVVRGEEVERVRQALLELPPAFREAIVLCDLEHVPYAEAADALGCPVGTVRSRLHRGRRMLMDRLRPGSEARALGKEAADARG